MRRPVAFTIVELLIVIAIIAVLMSILVPALRAAKEQASGAVCLVNQRGLIQPYILYTYDNRDYIVGGDTIGYQSGRHDWVDWPQNAAGAATATSPAKLVPQDEQRGIAKGALFKYTGSAIKVYHCPGDRRFTNSDPRANGWRSYSLPDLLDGYKPWIDQIGLGSVRKIEDIPAPSDKYIFVEEAETEMGHNDRSWTFDPLGRFPVPNGWFDPLAIWHNNKSTLSFGDGHAAMHAWQCETVIRHSLKGDKRFSCEIHGALCPDLRYLQLAYPRPK